MFHSTPQLQPSAAVWSRLGQYGLATTLLLAFSVNPHVSWCRASQTTVSASEAISDEPWQTISLEASKLDAAEGLLQDLFGQRADTTILLDRRRNEIRISGPVEVRRQAARVATAFGYVPPSDDAPNSRADSGTLPPLSNSNPSIGSDLMGSAAARLLPETAARQRANSPLSDSILKPRQRSQAIPAYQRQAYIDRVTALLGGKLQRQTRQGQPIYLYPVDSNRYVAFSFDESTNQIRFEGDPALVRQMESLTQALLDIAPNAESGIGLVRSQRTDRHKLTRVLNAYLDSVAVPKAATESPANSAIDPEKSDHTPKPAGPPSSSPTSGIPAPRIIRPLSDPATSRPQVRPVSFLSPIINQDLEVPSATLQFQDDTGRPQQGTIPDFGRNIEVEFLPDLDVIILRGRNQDLEQLAEIIERLEQLSEQTQPEVEVYQLQHVSADAMATLIAQVDNDLIRGRQGRVTITSLSKPNSLLLIGWGDAVLAIKDLIQKLDQPVAPEAQFKVYQLKNATAAAVQTSLTTFLANRTALGLRARLMADTRTNSIIVSASPRDFEEIDRIVEEMDRPEGMATSRGQVVIAKHVLATDLAQTLQLAISAIQTGDSRSAILELLTIDESGAEVIRSGALDNVSVTPQPRTNSVLVTAPPESLPLLLSLLEQLDQPGSSAQMKIFRIQNSDAASIVQVLRSLLPSETTTTQPFRLPNSGVASSVVPLRFSIDTRTNSLLAIGNEADLNVVEALVLRLDEKGALDRQTVVYHLKNAPARDISAAINQFLVNQRQLNQAAPGSTNPYQQLEQEVIIVPEPVGNRLILSATSRYFDEVSKLIQKLDEAPPQVMIQVLIAEVALNSADEFGIELGLQDTVLFDRSLLGDLLTTVNSTTTSTPAGVVTVTEEIIQAASNQPGFNFNSTGPLGNSGSQRALANSKTTGGQGISNFAVGRVNNELGFGGLVLSASGRNVSALLRALQESRRLEILSRPQIRSLDNQPAYIQVGQKVPRITGSVVNQNGQTNTVDLENVGLILGVTPRISPDGMVVMEVDAEKSQLGAEIDGIPITVSNDGTIIRSPRIETTTAQTTVSAASGETIVLGGLISKSQQQVNRKVPWLGDIPLLGRLFRFDSDIGKRTELVIILTPHVIRSSYDNERIKELELARMSWCAADVYDIHGDINLDQRFYDLEAETHVVYPNGAPPELPVLESKK
ncbi:MAG: hypothetical protein JNL67_12965 [Planctomycetaceae bacterium]|nr:hypothetical protein [Planctomycetaceae bacterium]